jgi:protein-S-isoprenylcysteine O-methyltransferase Ste14
MQRLIVLIFLGVLAWGVFHAVGAYRLNHNVARPLVVLGCTLAFLGFWLIMLRSRSRRIDRDDGPRGDAV